MTTDNVPMSALFIPQLGSQIYAMAGMRTKLHLLGNIPGVYEGMNTQYNGEGFSDMHFPVHMVTTDEFKQWVNQTRLITKPLNDESYELLLKPSINNKAEFFSGIDQSLFENVIKLYNNTYGKFHPRDPEANKQGRSP